MTSQIQGKWLAATEIKGDKQDNKLSALINQRLINEDILIFLPQKMLCLALSTIFFHILLDLEL